MSAATLSKTTGLIKVKAGERVLEIPHRDWIKIEDDEAFAENFRERRRSSSEPYGHIVTVFKIPLSADRLGLSQRISKDEWIEVFQGLPGKVTVQLRLDRGSYWVLSRNTYLLKGREAAVKRFINPRDPEFLVSLPEAEEALRLLFQAEIDRTRYQLRTTF